MSYASDPFGIFDRTRGWEVETFLSGTNWTYNIWHNGLLVRRGNYFGREDAALEAGTKEAKTLRENQERNEEKFKKEKETHKFTRID